jgi:hypothetical protein
MQSSHRNPLISTILTIGLAGLSTPAWAMDFAVAVPEPGTMALLLGGVGAAVIVWRNRRK